jgi:phosphinothricin acetyltransferase
MLLELAAVHRIDLSRAVAVGDSPIDEQGALAAGVGTFIWADTFFGREGPTLSEKVDIRFAERADLPDIVAIYNAAIPAHMATADLEPISVGSREAWFAAHNPDRLPLWVAVDEQNQVIGWLSFSTFYDRSAWDPTVEVSFYVDSDRQRQGVGRGLLHHALAAAPALGIFGHNEASIRLLESFGFERWGHLPEVTHMPEGHRDVVILGRKLDGRGPSRA